MKRIAIISALLLGACSHRNPMAPEPTPTASHEVIEQPMKIILADGTPYDGPRHHNIPVLLPDGGAGFMCETQPRGYSDGFTLDHYVIVGAAGCPETPIK